MDECGYCGEPADSYDAFCSAACREAWWLDADERTTMPFQRRAEWN